MCACLHLSPRVVPEVSAISLHMTLRHSYFLPTDLSQTPQRELSREFLSFVIASSFATLAAFAQGPSAWGLRNSALKITRTNRRELVSHVGSCWWRKGMPTLCHDTIVSLPWQASLRCWKMLWIGWKMGTQIRAILTSTDTSCDCISSYVFS